jgi:hypothetical protein
MKVIDKDQSVSAYEKLIIIKNDPQPLKLMLEIAFLDLSDSSSSDDSY